MVVSGHAVLGSSTKKKKAPIKSGSHDLNRAENLAKAFDSSLKIPGTDKTIGLDGILGLIPGIGDGFTSLVSGYIIYLAFQSGLPYTAIVRMVFNVLIDTIIGAIPILGDFSDLFWKANVRNVEIWKKHASSRRSSSFTDLLFIVSALVILGALVGSIIYGSIWLFAIIWRESISQPPLTP
jgi:hypothetical protein